MATGRLESDYLVIGAGDQGIAFAGALLASNKVATFIFVDPRHAPGGHWHDACPTARSQQPGMYYGCSYDPLDATANRLCMPSATNIGQSACILMRNPSTEERWDMATRDQILAYYNRVMQSFVRTGRVAYYPMCTYDAVTGQITHVLNRDEVWTVSVKRKVVDTMHSTQVPRSVAQTRAHFGVPPGVHVMPANELSKVVSPHPKYVVMGSGRTGMDAVLLLLSMGVPSNKMQWAVPRDHWCFCDEGFRPENFYKTCRVLFEAFGTFSREAPLPVALLFELERRDILCHIHDDDGALCRPGAGIKSRIKSYASTAFQGVKVSKEEIASLRQVTDIIRLGHVRAIHADKLELEHGSVPQPEGTLYIDCTGTSAHDAKDPVPIFEDRKITLQPFVEVYHGEGFFDPPFNAACLGMLESHYSGYTEWLNQICTPFKPIEDLRGYFNSLHIAWQHYFSHKINRCEGTMWTDERVATWLLNSPRGTPCSQNFGRLTSNPALLQILTAVIHSWPTCVGSLGGS